MTPGRDWTRVGKAFLSYSAKTVIFQRDSWFSGKNFVAFSEDLLELIAGHAREIKLYAEIKPMEYVASAEKGLKNAEKTV